MAHDRAITLARLALHAAEIGANMREFANVASSWLRWQLKGGSEAGEMLVGENCGLCTDENWETQSKGLE